MIRLLKIEPHPGTFLKRTGHVPATLTIFLRTSLPFAMASSRHLSLHYNAKFPSLYRQEISLLNMSKIIIHTLSFSDFMPPFFFGFSSSSPSPSISSSAPLDPRDPPDPPDPLEALLFLPPADPLPPPGPLLEDLLPLALDIPAVKGLFHAT